MEHEPLPYGTRVVWETHIGRPRATIVRHYVIGRNVGYEYVIKIDGKFGEEYVCDEEVTPLTVLDLMVEDECSSREQE